METKNFVCLFFINADGKILFVKDRAQDGFLMNKLPGGVTDITSESTVDEFLSAVENAFQGFEGRGKKIPYRETILAFLRDRFSVWQDQDPNLLSLVVELIEESGLVPLEVKFILHQKKKDKYKVGVFFNQYCYAAKMVLDIFSEELEPTNSIFPLQLEVTDADVVNPRFFQTVEVALERQEMGAGTISSHLPFIGAGVLEMIKNDEAFGAQYYRLHSKAQNLLPLEKSTTA